MKEENLKVFMQEFIDNIKDFADFIGALIHLFMLPIKLFFGVVNWVTAFPGWVQVILVFFGIVIMGIISQETIFTGPRGGRYRINSNGRKSYDVE